ncbi:MAG: hypothetical protein ACPGOV_04455 [Magnetovibrionaceae bacterium]
MPFDQAPEENNAPVRSFHELSFPEQLVLWSVRLWTQGNHMNICVLPGLCRAYAQAGAAGAVPPLDRLMVSLLMARRRVIQIRPVCCHGITADEAAILSLIAGISRRKQPRAQALLQQWMAPDLAVKCLAPATRFTDYLTRGGLTMPMRTWDWDALPKSAGKGTFRPASPSQNYGLHLTLH